MPDFSKSPGGFAAGESASNIAMQLAVVEEWGNGDVSILFDDSCITALTLTYHASPR